MADKLPILNLTEEELTELMEKVLKEDNLFNYDPLYMGPEYMYNCSICQDTGRTIVYGGPSRICSCREKY